jgi:hypothetical protein
VNGRFAQKSHHPFTNALAWLIDDQYQQFLGGETLSSGASSTKKLSLHCLCDPAPFERCGPQGPPSSSSPANTCGWRDLAGASGPAFRSRRRLELALGTAERRIGALAVSERRFLSRASRGHPSAGLGFFRCPQLGTQIYPYC